MEDLRIVANLRALIQELRRFLEQAESASSDEERSSIHENMENMLDNFTTEIDEVETNLIIMSDNFKLALEDLSAAARRIGALTEALIEEDLPLTADDRELIVTPEDAIPPGVTSNIFFQFCGLLREQSAAQADVQAAPAGSSEKNIAERKLLTTTTRISNFRRQISGLKNVTEAQCP